MLRRTLMTLRLTMPLTVPAHAGFGLVLPGGPIAGDPEKTSPSLVICAINPAAGAGILVEHPQVFTTLHYSRDNMDQSEYLFVLDEVVARGARVQTTNISLPYPGVYQLVTQTKAGWVSEQDKFVQYITKVQIPAYGSAEGQGKPANISFEISPLSRPFGLCSGMAFSGQAFFDGTPTPGALVDMTRLDPAIKPNVAQPEDLNMPSWGDKAQPKAKKQDKQSTPQSISAFGATQRAGADGQGVLTFVCPLPSW